MAQNNSDIKLGRFISLILRHKPEEIGLTLDLVYVGFPGAAHIALAGQKVILLTFE